ncbi:MAG TPA: MIP/aquaporin family protein [Actinomycetota bacterium]|jgi:glycerol uptake facilitator protein|nr:MIP/aquaporin family protein [Actinomycetota bacterium]
MKRDTLLGELSAEMLGTFTLIIFGVGVVAQTVLTPFTAGAQSIHWAWGIGVVMGVYVAGGISGAHINPAVTLAFAVRRGFPWAKVLPYWVAQTVGAFLAALVIRWNYFEAFNKFDPAKGVKSQLVFSTLPGNNALDVSQLGAFRDQIIGTAMLVMLVLALVDTRNLAPSANMGPFLIGLIVVGIGMALGADAGYAINPARDFGPRLASWITGWSNAWNDQRGDFYAWVPILGPFIGGVLGAFVYDWFISRFLPVSEPEVGRVPEAPETARATETT